MPGGDGGRPPAAADLASGPRGSSWLALRRALSLVRSAAPGWSLGYLAVCVLSGLLGPLGAWSLGRLVGAVQHPAAGRAAMLAVCGVVLSSGLLATLTPLSRLLQAELARRVKLRARTDLLAAVAGIPLLDRVEDPSFGDQLRLAQDAGSTVPVTVVQVGFAAVQGLVSAAGFTATLAATAGWSVPAGLACIVPGAIAGIAASRRQAAVGWQTSPAVRRQIAYAGLLTDLRAAKEIRLFGLADVLVARMREEISGIDSRERRVQRRAALVQGALSVLRLACVLAALLWATRLTLRHEMTAGHLTALIAALGGLDAAASALVRSASTAYTGLLSFRHYGAVIDQAQVLGSAPDGAPARPAIGIRPRQVPALRRGIRVENLTYAYPGRPPVLAGCSLTIPKGATVALVGANGAGKSTLVKLLCGLYRPAAGRICWDGIDIASCDLFSLRKRVSAVFQDFMTYELSAADNIGFGDTSLLTRLDALTAAARAAGIHDHLAGLPRGYDTTLSRALRSAADERDGTCGMPLSGGQWQRVALARAILRDRADLLILDEPSSGLDAAAEAGLHQQLAALSRGTTTVVITHRLAMTRDADLIAVLDGGAFTEQGTHRQLMSLGGTYARMFDTQAAAYRPGPDALAARADGGEVRGGGRPG